MQHYEYKAVSAPRRANRVKGVRLPADRFARTLTDLINTEAKDGWEYLRADTLPVEQKSGMLSSAKEVLQTVLVFRRAVHAPTVAETRPGRPDLEAARAPLPLGPADRRD